MNSSPLGGTLIHINLVLSFCPNEMRPRRTHNRVICCGVPGKDPAPHDGLCYLRGREVSVDDVKQLGSLLIPGRRSIRRSQRTAQQCLISPCGTVGVVRILNYRWDHLDHVGDVDGHVDGVGLPIRIGGPRRPRCRCLLVSWSSATRVSSVDPCRS